MQIIREVFCSGLRGWKSFEFARIPVFASLDDDGHLEGQFFEDPIEVLRRYPVVEGQGYTIDRLEFVVHLQSRMFEHAVACDGSNA